MELDLGHEMEGGLAKGAWAAEEVWGFRPAAVGGGPDHAWGVVQRRIEVAA